MQFPERVLTLVIGNDSRPVLREEKDVRIWDLLLVNFLENRYYRLSIIAAFMLEITTSLFFFTAAGFNVDSSELIIVFS